MCDVAGADWCQARATRPGLAPSPLQAVYVALIDSQRNKERNNPRPRGSGGDGRGELVKSERCGGSL
jgi:hypothetical protein